MDEKPKSTMKEWIDSETKLIGYLMKKYRTSSLT